MSDCACKPHGPIHPWEPGEWCPPTRVIPEPATVNEQLPLGLITVHCFACTTTVEAATPDAAHDAMECHYRVSHRELIESIIGTATT